MYQLQLFDFGKQNLLKIFNQKPTFDELHAALGDFSEYTNALLEKDEAVISVVTWLKLVEVRNE